MYTKNKVRIQKTCAQCGSPFSVTPSNSRLKFCSQKCYWQSMENKISTICGHCQTPISVFPSKVKRSVTGISYCGEKCAKLAMRRPIAERFWEKVNKDGPIPPHRPELGQCWLWTAATDHHGYGALGKENGQRGKVGAHRVSYSLEYGDLKEEDDCLHKCDNPTCVRPSHLFKGTAKDNSQDAIQKGRFIGRRIYAKGSAHCNAKLTEDIVRLAKRRALTEKRFIKSMAQEVGVSDVALQNAVNGKTWKHVNI